MDAALVEVDPGGVEMNASVMEMLKPMFPGLSDEIIRASVEHPTNRTGELSEVVLLNRCLDDLLNLRTFHMANQR